MFTYVGKETSYITSVFRQADLKIALSTNTVRNLLMHKNLVPLKFSLLEAYRLTCSGRNKAYVGETGRCFTIRCNGHKQAFRNNSHMSRYAQHINKEGHSFGTIDNIVQVLEYHKKGAHLNTIE